MACLALHRATRSKYQSLTIKRKLEIIDIVENAPNRKKQKDIGGVPKSTLSTIIKNKGKIRQSSIHGSGKNKRSCEPTHQDVDIALFDWFTTARPIGGEILKKKAQEFSYLLDETECSNGWLGRWKTRHNVKYKAISGENAFVDKDVCKEWKRGHFCLF